MNLGAPVTADFFSIFYELGTDLIFLVMPKQVKLDLVGPTAKWMLMLLEK